jgi:hypothetical protein
MDSDKAQKNILEKVFLDTPILLCIWYINQYILANYKSIIGNEDWPVFEAT